MRPQNKKILIALGVGLLLFLGVPGSASAEALIMDFEVGEGRSPYLQAIPDAKGYWQIGFGSIYHYDLNRLVRQGDTITTDTAYRYLRMEIKKVSDWIDSHVTVPLTANQKKALVSLGYNIGTGSEGLGGSTLIRLLNSGAPIQQVADQFDVWRIADGRINQGLVNRRAKEKQIFLT